MSSRSCLWCRAFFLLSASCVGDWDRQVADGVARQRAEEDAGAGDEHEADTNGATSSSPDALSEELDAGTGFSAHDAYLWLSADRDLLTDVSGRVLAWADRSEQGISAVAESEQLAPTLQRYGDLPLVAFDGSQELRLPELAPLGVLTFFAVADVAVEDRKCPSILHLSNSDDGIIQVEDLEFGRHQRELYYESGSKSVPQGAMHTGSFSTEALHVLAVRHEPSTLAVTRIDGANVHARMMELPALVTRSRNYIGHNHYFYNGAPSCEGFMGRIAEIIVFARLLDDGERTEVERYLSEKWAVPLRAEPE